jgi:16S rRNA (cytosine1402-N4)-methyltransferase
MSGHRPVLLRETLDALAVRQGGIYVDGTFGRGGHSKAILERLGPQGLLLAIDRDPEAVAAARELAAADARLRVEHAPFSRLAELVRRHGLEGRVDGLLLDLGVSSPQLDTPERGFGFLRDGPLDMRMNPQSDTPGVAAWLAHADEREIAAVLRDFGEERHARRIARAIVQARAEAPIERTGRLAEIVAAAHPAWEKGKHPATRSFQALRIFVNRELEELEQVLADVEPVLAVGGRLAVISFHSLEDRMVKRFFKSGARGDELPRGLPVTADMQRPRWKLLNRGVKAGEAELAENPRARSAVLRAGEKLSTGAGR